MRRFGRMPAVAALLLGYMAILLGLAKALMLGTIWGLDELSGVVFTVGGLLLWRLGCSLART